MMRRYEQPPCLSAAGLATGSILALIAAMAVSVAFDTTPSGAGSDTQFAHASSVHAS